jgi:hypothetical protein
MDNRKPWWRSRTIWFNAIVGGLATLEASAHLVAAFVPGNIYGWGLLLLSVGNAMLRIITTQGVALK